MTTCNSQLATKATKDAAVFSANPTCLLLEYDAVFLNITCFGDRRGAMTKSCYTVDARY